MKNALLFIILALGLTACFPVYKKLKPEFEVNVVDENGQAVANAQIILLTEVHPAINIIAKIQKLTDAQGVAKFSGQREWKVESLMIHGSKYYHWSICVRKSGFITQGMIDADQSKIKVVLLPQKADILLSESEKVLQDTVDILCAIE